MKSKVVQIFSHLFFFLVMASPVGEPLLCAPGERGLVATWPSCARALAANVLQRNGTIRWLHIPKTGSTLIVSAGRFGCEVEVWQQLLHGRLSEGVFDFLRHVRQSKYASKCPAQRRSVGHSPPFLCALAPACPRLAPEIFHQGVYPQQLGALVGMFRHPRDRIRSFCRATGGGALQTATAHEKLAWHNRSTDPEDDPRFLGCIKDHLMHQAYGLTVRQLTDAAGVRNSVWSGGQRMHAGKQWPDLSRAGDTLVPAAAGGDKGATSLVSSALHRVIRAFAFVGLTDEWRASVELFHALLLPSIPIHPGELRVISKSAVRVHGRPVEDQDLTVDRHASWSLTSLKAAATLTAVQGNKEPRIFGAADAGNLRALQRDPDLLVYAAARLAFCHDYLSEVKATNGLIDGATAPPNPEHRRPPAPHTCETSRGPLVDIGGGAQAQVRASKELLRFWGGDKGLGGRSGRGRQDFSTEQSQSLVASLAGQSLVPLAPLPAP